MATYHPFDPANIVTIPHFSYEDETRWQGFDFEKELQTAVFDLPDVEAKDLHNLQPGAFVLNLEEAPIPSLEASSASSYTTAEDDLSRYLDRLDKDADQEPWENIWSHPEIRDDTRRLKLTSWDHFSDSKHREPGTAYLSEAGAPTFDAIVSSLSVQSQTVLLVASDTFLHALYELGLGRSSALFQWSEEENQFTCTVDDFTITGCTPGLVQLVVDSTAAAGAVMRTLGRPDTGYGRSSHHTRPGEIAFRSVLRSNLTAIQQYMDNQRHRITSVLCLEQTYSNVLPLLEMLNYVATMVKDSDSDHALLRSLLRWSIDTSLQHPHFEPVVDCLISCVAQPVLQELSCDVGLKIRHCNSNEEPHTSDENQWADVLPVGIVQIVYQTAETLKLLRVDSNKLTAFVSTTADRDLEIGLSWASILDLQAAADEYERTAKVDLLSHNSHQQPELLTYPPVSRLDSEICRIDGADAFELLNIDRVLPVLNEPDRTSSLVLECLNYGSQSKDVGLGYDEAILQSISPLLFAQHRLASYSIFELLFTRQNLLSHLTLQHHIQLLGDGMFAARLRIALFDPEQSSGEDRRRTGATTGLRLQSRDAWPPASSELRLVLMGVLSESVSTSGVKSLEDTVSFAIRDLSEEDMEKCRDVDSVHALDFLKLHFRPPNTALEAVISSESLEKYDKIFQHLLRVLRLKSVAQALLRGASRRPAPARQNPDHKIHIEIQKFVSAIADYCQNVAVARPWTAFYTTMLKIESKLAIKDYDGVLSLGQSLDSLKRKHEDTLDSVLRALLLKRKQKQVLEVLEKIFSSVLQYAAALRKEIDETMRKGYHKEIRNLVKRFVTLLREVVRGNDVKESNGDGVGMFEELLLRVDFNEYWSR